MRLLAPLSAATDGFDSNMARRCLVQATLTRLGIGLATVRVRLRWQRPHRTLFRIHCLSKKPTSSAIRRNILTENILTEIGGNTRTTPGRYDPQQNSTDGARCQNLTDFRPEVTSLAMFQPGYFFGGKRYSEGGGIGSVLGAVGAPHQRENQERLR